MIIHFIAIGGSVMHNLAIALHKKGYKITGSDDEIFEPARSRLQKCGLLPSSPGWYPEKINPSLDAVILGMHARDDNPELIKARKMGVRIYSFPEYLYEQTRNKKRIIIAGSHGKTTVTSMIMHALKVNGFNFDYMTGSLIEGFDTMVDLSDENTFAVFEGDEYLTSPLDPRPKFHLYKPHIGLITGIAWDHMNVFPSFENYVEQFRIFAGMISEAILYFKGDPSLSEIIESRKDIRVYPYDTIPSEAENDKSVIIHKSNRYPLQIFGQHNMQNLAGAMQVCKLMGLNEEKFLYAMTFFKGAARRQQHLTGNGRQDVYLDFAHAPSKVRATVEAFRQQFRNRKIIACLELHTFSSLNSAFLPQYKNSLKHADAAIVFYDPAIIEHKRLEILNPGQVKAAFNREDLIVLSDREMLEPEIMKMKSQDSILLIMTSGNFLGLSLDDLANHYIN